jgi:hypothetical protein
VIAAIAAVSAGLAFGGDAVMWGEEARNGAVRVIKDGVLVHRVPPATARKTERGFPCYEERPRGPARIDVREL